MKLIQFLDNGTEHASEYAWRLAMLSDGTGLYAPLDTDEDLMNIVCGIASVADMGGHLTVNKKIHASKESAFIWAENNIAGSFREYMANEDITRCLMLQDISALINWNRNKEKQEGSFEDGLGYGFAMAVMMFGTDTAKDLPMINWLMSRRYDDICEQLASADAYVPKTTGASCGCGNTETVNDKGCSALDIYRRYMDGQVVEYLGNIDSLHTLLMMPVSGTMVRNEVLISVLSESIGNWTPNYVLSNTDFGCPDISSADNEYFTVFKNAVIALGYIGTDDECRYKKFIGYWMSRLGELLIKY